MTDTVKLKPAPGARVRKEDGTLLAPDGEPVALSAYWRRRLADEDVVQSADEDVVQSNAKTKRSNDQ